MSNKRAFAGAFDTATAAASLSDFRTRHDLQEQEELEVNTATKFYTAAKRLAVASIRFANPFTLPRRIARRILAIPKKIYKRFEGPIRYAVVPIVREDGAIKKRLLALSTLRVLSPSPLVTRSPRVGARLSDPRHRALINAHRRSPNIDAATRNQCTELGWLPFGTPSPITIGSVHGSPSDKERSAQASPNIWSPSPIAGRLSPISQPNFGATTPTPTAGRLSPISQPNFGATTPTLSTENDALHAINDVDMDIWSPTPPAGRLPPISQPNFGTITPTPSTENGALRAINDVDMDIWSPTPTGPRFAPVAQPIFQAATPTEHAENQVAHADEDVEMDIHSPTPTGEAVAPISQPTFSAATSTEFTEEEAQPTVDNVHMDDNLDFSFSDILTSTPPRQGLAQSQSPIAWDSPSIYAENSPSTNAENTSSTNTENGPSTNTENSPSTPICQNLLKMQLRRGADLSDIAEESETEAAEDQDESDLPLQSSSPFQSDVGSPEPEAEVPSSPFQEDVDSSPFQSNVSSSPFQSNVDSSPFQSNVDSSPFQSNVGSSPFQSNVDSSPFQINVDDSPLPRRKQVRWARYAGAKSFYVDEKVSEMLDSSLDTITSSPVRRNDEDEDADDSLEESELSSELLENLQELDLASPSVDPPKPLVMPLDSQEIDSLDEIAKASEYGQTADFSIVEDKLTAKDFATLLPRLFNGDPRAWLNDEIVNDYLAILTNHKKNETGFVKSKGGPAPHVHAFSSFWYTQIKAKKESVKRWAFRAQLQGAQYLDAKLVLYPICDRGHWRLLAVKPQERTIQYFDSLGLDGETYIETLMEYLEMELEDHFTADEWTVIEGRSTQQVNGSDCGVFTLLNALALLRGEDSNRVIACDGMIDARERIAITLMQQKPTTEME